MAKKLAKKQNCDIAEWLELDKEYVKKVMKLLEENPDVDDIKIGRMTQNS